MRNDNQTSQQTLRAAIGWSYDLLGSAEQVAFRRLAIFAGSWTVRAAEAVCADSDLPAPHVIQHLRVLLDDGLVHQVNSAADGPRFAMLASVREYAMHRLIESGDATSVAARHRDWCLTHAEVIATEPFEDELAEPLA